MYDKIAFIDIPTLDQNEVQVITPSAYVTMCINLHVICKHLLVGNVGNHYP